MKPHDIFTEQEADAVRAALQLSLGENPILPHWEFPILTGVSVEKGLEILARWPEIDVSLETEWLLLSNTLGRLKGYPHKQKQRLFDETGLQKDDLKRLLDKLRPIKPF